MVIRLVHIRDRMLRWAGRWLGSEERHPAPPASGATSMGERLESQRSSARTPAEHDSLRRLADHLPNAMLYQLVSHGEAGRRFTYVSRSVEQLHEVTVEEVLADAAVLYDQVVPEHREGLQAAEAIALRDHSSFRQEVAFRLPSGQIRWSELNSIPNLRPDGRVVWDGLEVDITQRKLVEQALRRSEGQFRTLADNIAQMAWMTDETGWIFWYNQRWFDYTGTTLEEVQGWGWQNVHHPDHLQRVIEKFRQHLEAGTAWEDTFPLRGRNGQYRWFLSRAIPIRDEDGKVQRWFGTNTDITEQRETEQHLRESRAQYRSRLAELQTIYESAPIGLCVLDRELRYVRVNDRLAEINGIPAEQHIGRTVREVVPDLADQQEPVFREVFESGRPVVDREVSGETRATPGVVRHWIVSYYPLPNEAGEVIGVNVTAAEISDRKRSEQQRQQLLEAEQAARAELERYNRLKDEFLATVSHELRSPLNAILGWTRLLAHGKAEPGRAIKIVERNAASLAQIVEDLLDMSRIISGKILLQRSVADIAALARNALESIQLSAQAKNIAVDCWMDPRLRPIPCDPNRIQQVIWNLLTNAVKFTPPGGQVWLRVAQESASLVLSVKDTGQGIPPDFLSQVFGRFQQVDSSTTRKHGGLGLGLSIAKQLVELHGGTIEAHSEGLEKGATFTVRLPSTPRFGQDGQAPGRRQGEPSVTGPSDDQEDTHDLPLAGLTALIVDDDADSCELTGRVLREAGALVHVAHSAEAGFDLLMRTRPDVLLSDISMPQQDGFAFIRKIRACGSWCSDLLCIALTALARPEDRDRVLTSGYNEYLTKPFDAAALPLLISSRAGGPRTSESGATPPSPARAPENQMAVRSDARRREPSGTHILLAEDNQAVGEMLRIFLEGSGYRVTAVPTVRQALCVAQQESVDLLLTDFRLKDGTAWELLPRIQEIREVPALILSGYSEKVYIERSKAAGFRDYLVKPVDEEELLAAVRDALARP